MQFKVKQNFFSQEMQSQYATGMTYTIRPFSALDRPDYNDKQRVAIKARCDALPGLVAKWAAEGKVEVGEFPAAQVTGGS